MTRIRPFLWLAVASALVTGCSWSSFDDLADETWVDSVGGADGTDPNVFAGVASPGVTAENAVFVSLGRASDSIGNYVYDPDGARTTHGVEIIDGSTELGVLPLEVPFVGDPYSNNVALGAFTNQAGNGDTKVVAWRADDVDFAPIDLDFNRNNDDHPLDGPTMPTGLAFARTDVSADATDVVVARGNELVLISNYEGLQATDPTFHSCYPETVDDIVMSVGAGDFAPDDPDDEIIVVSNDLSGTLPQILFYDASVIQLSHATETEIIENCALGTPGPLRLPLDGPAGVSGFGSELVVGDFDGDGDPDFAISSPTDNQVEAYLWDPATDPEEISVGAPTDAQLFGKALAAGDLDGDGDDELIIGAPDSDVDGTDNAGVVYVYSLQGGAFTQVMAVHDAQPESGQKMGREVTVMPWGGDRMALVVAGESEIFVYFRTSLYEDVRE